MIHGLWCSVACLFIPALKGITKELIFRANPRGHSTTTTTTTPVKPSSENTRTTYGDRTRILGVEAITLTISGGARTPPHLYTKKT